MMKKTNTLLASAVAAGVLMMAAQGAAAADKTKAPAASKSAPSANAAAGAIEQRMKMMEEQMQMMKSELTRVRSEASKPAESSAKLEDRLAKLETSGGAKKKSNNMVFFRGGYAKNDHDRSGDLLVNANGVLDNGSAGGLSFAGAGDSNQNQDAWYFGAGFDFSLTDNAWGLLAGTPLNNTGVLAELMFEYKNLDHTNFRNVAGNGFPVAGSAGANPLSFTVGIDGRNRSVTVSQVSISAAPKVKFLEGSAFRPWIIPIGFSLEINSPPSDGVTYLNPGLVFGAGADYNFWGPLFVGADARYHLSANDNDGVPTDGLTAGGYLGIGF